ncbi:MAG: hypothetical protein KIT33_12765 [Candidatus Kapabacteria bacterium]|nr:hypothetical protein [Ignavibacteriota bacterium]MCW5885833.1 hypothetical protein [Candidatus Kapabacteria bacterium]
MKFVKIFSLLSILIIAISCSEQKTPENNSGNDMLDEMTNRITTYAPIDLKVDISHLTEREKILIQKLIEAGEIVDRIFWKQASHDAIAVRDSLRALNTDEANKFLEFVMINYGPYDDLTDKARFVGIGPERRPVGGGFYPEDMTKEEFDAFVEANPTLADVYKNDYTIITRENGNLKAIPYGVFYPESMELAEKLQEAANFADNESLKRFLIMRADAIRTDNYFPSDMAWMEIVGSNIDVVIGPIENYQDEMFNYKTAHEAVIMVKDIEATRELEMYKANLDNFEHNLPIDDKFKNKTIGDGNIIQVCNVVYFGGDCNQAIKTIASALPNDPKVADAKGRKLSMFKNHMEAKFEAIVKPIGELMFVPERAKYLSSKAFTSFVTLHEVSHALGPKYTSNANKEEIRAALKERYSAIEETKADILSMFNHKYLRATNQYTDEYIKQAMTTYVAGLYRSIRFGGGAHYRANLIQLNYLKQGGAILRLQNGKFDINEEKFFDVVENLAKEVLMIQVNGDYDKAGEMLDKFSVVTQEIEEEIKALSNIPRDINPKYIF